ncbi:MAG: hypothetical protein MOB07_18575 [Acidobacteria bacterium]|nr:hypothetical protein [Acidobacteriota bacterium]
MDPLVLKDTLVPEIKLNPSMISVVVEAPALTEGGDKLDSSGGRLMLTAPEVKLTGSGVAAASKTWLDALIAIGVEPAGAVVDAVKVIVASCSVVLSGNVCPAPRDTSIPILPPPWLELNVAPAAPLPGSTETTLKIWGLKLKFKLTAVAVSFVASVSSSTETVVFPPRHAIAFVTRTVRP